VPTYRELLSQARRQIREIAADELLRLVKPAAEGPKAVPPPSPPLLIDVREADEYASGRLPGAVHIPRGFLESRIERTVPDHDAPVVLYCAAGNRSALAARTLAEMGYTHVSSLSGGYDRWTDSGLPIERPRVLRADQRERYRRHLIIPEVGEEGQAKLLDAKVLLMGAGGLGSPAALYLAAAGVGTLGIVDMDVVDLSNLQRQVLHTTERLGMPKTESARKSIQALNPDVKVIEFNERLTSENVESIVSGFDLVLDGGDNFPTRYLLNDACVLLKKPNIHGSIYRFEGQVTTFVPGEGPCYRCLYPTPPPPELAPSCAEAGVLGVLPGIVGLFQANEAIKLILGKGRPLVGRLLTFDALETNFTELRLRRDPNCPVCADGVPFPGFIDYEQFCSASAA
jgi:molybdopterin/thiamine biosynthesis adenylyltransferase/rhodanese-related sulfurtransferase